MKLSNQKFEQNKVCNFDYQSASNSAYINENSPYTPSSVDTAPITRPRHFFPSSTTYTGAGSTTSERRNGSIFDPDPTRQPASPAHRRQKSLDYLTTNGIPVAPPRIPQVNSNPNSTHPPLTFGQIIRCFGITSAKSIFQRQFSVSKIFFSMLGRLQH